MNSASVFLSFEECKGLRAVLADALLHEASCMQSNGYRLNFHGYRVFVMHSGMKRLSYSVSCEGAVVEQGEVAIHDMCNDMESVN